MNPIRVLLAVKPRLLRDALHAVLARHARLMVVDEESNTIDILMGAREHLVDVVIMTLEPTSDVPPLVERLLAQFPEMMVIGIHPHEQCAGIYRTGDKVRMLPDLTVSGIIRAVFQGESKHSEPEER